MLTALGEMVLYKRSLIRGYLMFKKFLLILCTFSVLPAYTNHDDTIKVEKAWVRPSQQNKNTALYLGIINSGSQLINLIKVRSNVSSEIQLHDTLKNGNIMGMHEIQSVPLEPGVVTEFKPGHEHIMLMHLQRDLKVGETINITLEFDNKETKTVTVPIKMSDCDCQCE